MKKLIIAALALASASAFAAQNDVLLTFSTKGPDKYANGDPVADGECYCVVWTKQGSFEGFNADGTAAGSNSVVVLTAPIAKDGRCPMTQFQIGYAKAKALGAGHYGVYLLDTRRADGDKKPMGTVLTDGVWLAQAINSWGLISDATMKLESVDSLSTTTVASTSVTNKTTVASAVPAGAPQPTIADIRINGDQVEIDVADTAAYLQYTLAQGDEPDAKSLKDNERDGGVVAQGNGNVITIKRPFKQGGQFFKVIRN